MTTPDKAVVGSQPLNGLKVIDMGQVYLGPYAGLLFGFSGAEVIKIEPPSGDSIRFATSAGENPGAMLLNTNKKSIVLDLNDEVDRDAFRELISDADVLVENFRPGTMEKLGLGYDTLKEINPRLVYGSGKGYAADSIYADAPAMDFPIQALTGLIAVTGFADGPPVKSGAAITDFLTGVHLYAGILAALLEREKTGTGQKVDVAMQDVAHHSLASNISGYLISPDNFAERTGNQHALEIAPYDVFPTKDGTVAIMCLVDKHWVALSKAMGMPELGTDPRFEKNIDRAAKEDELDELVKSWTTKHTREEIFQALNDFNVPGAPVRHIAEVARDKDMIARGMLFEHTHPQIGPVPVPGSPFHFSRHAQTPPRPAPSTGQDTDEVLGRGTFSKKQD